MHAAVHACMVPNPQQRSKRAPCPPGAENQRAKDINVDFLARMEAEAAQEMARLEELAKKRAAAGAK